MYKNLILLGRQFKGQMHAHECSHMHTNTHTHTITDTITGTLTCIHPLTDPCSPPHIHLSVSLSQFVVKRNAEKKHIVLFDIIYIMCNKI